MIRDSSLGLAGIVAIVFVFATGSAYAQVTYEPIVFTGDAAPGAGAGVTFANVFYPHFESAGQITFYGDLSGPDVDSSNNLAVYRLDADGLHLAIREGDAAPGIDGAYLQHFPHYAIVGPGLELLFCFIGGPSPQDPMIGNAAWLRTPAATTLITCSGNPAPDTEAGTRLGDFSDLYADRERNVLFETYLKGPAVTPGTAQAVYAGPASSPRLLARGGNPAPDTGGKLFKQMLLPKLGAGGHVAFIANVSGDDDDRYNRLFCGTTEQVHQAIGPGTHAPGTETGAQFRTLWCSRVNALGQVLLPMDSALAGPGVDDHNDDGVWAGTPDNLQLVARSGDIAPGTEGKRFNGIYDMWLDDERPMFIDPVLGDGGHVAFSARLTDAEGDLLPEWGFWAGRPGSLRLIENHAVRQPRINALGQMVYADSFGDDSDAPGAAMVFADLQGHRQIIVHTGQIFDFGNGDLRTLWGWDSDTNDNAPLSDSGQFLIDAVFTDGSSAVILATIPEPALLPLLLLMTALGSRRPRTHQLFRR